MSSENYGIFHTKPYMAAKFTRSTDRRRSADELTDSDTTDHDWHKEPNMTDLNPMTLIEHLRDSGQIRALDYHLPLFSKHKINRLP